MSKLLYCVQIRNTEGRIGDESYIKYSDIDLFTVYVQLVLSGLERIRLDWKGLVWTGQDSAGVQDSARRSGTGYYSWSGSGFVWCVRNYCMVSCWRQCVNRNLTKPSEIHPRDRG